MEKIGSKSYRRKIRRPLPPSFTKKWSGEVLDEGFVPFPKRLLLVVSQVFSGDHAIEDLAVVLAIADYLRPDLIRWPSTDFLAFTAGLSKGTFMDRLRALEERGLVETEGPDNELTVSLDGLLRQIVGLTSDQQAVKETGGEE